MKITSKRMRPAIMFLYVLLFTSATGAFNSMACELSVMKENSCPKKVMMPEPKKAQLPVLNPLQILTSKFL